jgi:hypothetical protein
LFGHVLGAFAAPTARSGQALGQSGVVGVETQADDVDGGVGKGDRDFDAREVGHALRMGSGGGAVLAADFVMVGERPQLDTVGFRAGGQILRGQGSVGYHGMAMQVGVQYGCHRAILGLVPISRATAQPLCRRGRVLRSPARCR